MVKKISIISTALILLSLIAYTEEIPQVLKTFPARETWFLPTGTVLKATTMNAIFSFNLESPVVAELDEPALCPKTNAVVLPKKTKLIGSASILKSDDRVNVTFYLIVLPAPSGKEYAIQGIILHPDGSAGLKGTVKEYKEVRLMSSAASGAVLGIGQAVAATAGQPIVGQALGGALTSSAGEIQTGVTQKVDISISVPPYQKCGVFLMNRVVLDENK
jgi:hypothetical protein